MVQLSPDLASRCVLRGPNTVRGITFLLLFAFQGKMASRMQHAPYLDQLGAHLEATRVQVGDKLEPSWSKVGTHGLQVGLKLGSFGSHVGHLEANLAPTPDLKSPRCPQTPPGPLWGPPEAQKMPPKSFREAFEPPPRLQPLTHDGAGNTLSTNLATIRYVISFEIAKVCTP